MEDKTDPKARILNAAFDRMMHYGYGKTTMAEIASDCGMSPGNIYRFYEAKIDIAEAMARRHFAEEHAALAAITQRRDKPATWRLREFCLTRSRDAHKLYEESPRIREISDVLGRERPLFNKEFRALQIVMVTAILDDGVAAGLFAPCDTARIAECVLAGLGGFVQPHRHAAGVTTEHHERQLNDLVSLILRGIATNPLDVGDLASANER